MKSSVHSFHIKSTIGQKGYEPSTIMIYVKDRGIVLKESSMAIIHSETSMIMAIECV
ncbi:hypothetical protein GPL15_06100 [Clostridium sp. MCC353]|nr:hypothetical protein [Clostridium sp. MCC353]MBT9776075.1 hypothetical protein [Clostridium sp. MCC353]